MESLLSGYNSRDLLQRSCDGVRSPTRRTLLTQAAADLGQPELTKMIPAVWSSARVYRATIPVEKLNQAWQAEVGPNQLHRVHSEVTVVVRFSFLFAHKTTSYESAYSMLGLVM